jgi:hypothetical protein
MILPSQRWLRIIFLATAIVFVSVAVYLYGLRFFAWLESDAAVTALLGDKALHARSPVVADWYYANGDVWIVAPQLLAMFTVAIFGLGPASLLAAVVLGFVLEIVVLVKLYQRIGAERWVAIFAAMATLMAWSNAHVAYAYIQLAYGLGTMLYLLAFAWFAALAEGAPGRPWRWAGAVLLVAAIAAQNPTRWLVFVIAPLLAGCVWPWRAFGARRRLALAATACAGWALAYAAYTLLSRFVAFSIPRGHVGFVFGGVTRIKTNLAMLGEGLSLLYGGDVEPGLRLIPCALLILGAVALVGREVLRARELTALRFVSMVVIAQLGLVLVPLLIGNLLDGPLAVRYLMPSVLSLFGLAVVIAVRTLAEASPRWRRLATGYLVAVPLTALLAVPEARPPAPSHYLWPDAPELSKIADQLVERGLTHGFADNLAANLLTLDARGAALTCRIRFRNVIMPERWLASTSCYDASKLPDRFYVVAYRGDDERNALRATLPPEIERFSAGDTYEVHVYRTLGTSPEWLDLPLPDGSAAAFPMRLLATHLQLIRDKAAVEDYDLVATGQPGTVVSGPNIELPRGRYTATWIGRAVPSSGELAFAVTSRGRRVLARTGLEATQLPIHRSDLVRLAFTVDRPQNRIEFPIESTGGARVALYELVIEKAR